MEERMMILSMLEKGNITDEEASMLLEALDDLDTKESDKIIYKSDNDVDQGNTAVKKTCKSEKWENNLEESLGNLGEKIGKSMERQGVEFEKFGEELGERMASLGEDIAESATSMTERLLNTIDKLRDNGSFVNIFGNYYTISQNIEEDISDITNPVLDFEAINGRISVVPWSKDKIFVKAKCQIKKSLYNNKEAIYNVYKNDNRISFKPIFTKGVGINLEVSIPKREYDRINLKTSNGKLEMTDINSNEIICNTSNSTIDLEGLNSKNIKADTKNGRIILEDINSKVIEVNTTNSSINLDSITCEHIDAITKNAKIIMDNVRSKTINAITTNASIKTDTPRAESIKYKTTNGKILVEDIDTDYLDNITLVTTNSTIEASFKGSDAAFNISAETSHGNINLEIPDLVYSLNDNKQSRQSKVKANSINYKENENCIDLTASTSNGNIKITC